MTTCERIDAILQERGMSRRKLAIKAGIAPSSLQSAMARNTTLSLDMLFPISDILNIPVTELAGVELPEIPDDVLEKEAAKLEPSSFDKPLDSGSIKEAILTYMEKLNTLGKLKMLERAEELLEVPRYKEGADNG